ncbi:competence type IV pilus major pilin ComGC [Companilactobacillus insicii]|uniref:competence type IV pilus major pilin ComGC n=1 Tax=Companilactobacillus insicii TaxID=1732567 RepID=UPI000F78FC74|nr:competence type IV pilus major pilin ComGC [Companilactobacillus insicii]
MKKIIKKTKEAFTLIEMVIVLFIISLLLLVMIPNLGTQKNNADTKSEAAFVATLQTQVDMYATDENGSTPTWKDLSDKGYISKKQSEKVQNKYVISDKKDNTGSYIVESKNASSQK